MGSFFRLLDRSDQGRFKLDREAVDRPVQKWSSRQVPVRPGQVGRVHRKISQPCMPSNISKAEYMRRVGWPWKHSLRDPNKQKKSKPKQAVAEPVKEISAEEAERLSSDMIKSFSNCRMMQELLEDAKYFVGAGGLVGAPASRRARTKRPLTDD